MEYSDIFDHGLILDINNKLSGRKVRDNTKTSLIENFNSWFFSFKNPLLASFLEDILNRYLQEISEEFKWYSRIKKYKKEKRRVIRKTKTKTDIDTIWKVWAQYPPFEEREIDNPLDENTKVLKVEEETSSLTPQIEEVDVEVPPEQINFRIIISLEYLKGLESVPEPQDYLLMLYVIVETLLHLQEILKENFKLEFYIAEQSTPKGSRYNKRTSYIEGLFDYMSTAWFKISYIEFWNIQKIIDSDGSICLRWYLHENNKVNSWEIWRYRSNDTLDESRRLNTIEAKPWIDDSQFEILKRNLKRTILRFFEESRENYYYLWIYE